MDEPKTRWRIRQLLKDRGWSPTDLQERTKLFGRGVPLQTINDICANKARGFTLSTVGILTVVLECRVEDLMEVVEGKGVRNGAN